MASVMHSALTHAFVRLMLFFSTVRAENNADANLQKDDGGTALMFAATAGHAKV